MMVYKLRLYICTHYKREIETVLKTLPQYKVKVLYLGNHGSCFPLTESECSSITEDNGSFESSLVIGGTCLSSLKNRESTGLELSILDNCFSLFCPMEIINGFIDEGAYIMTPHWLQHWEDHLKVWGVDETNHNVIFKDNLKKIVLLDTGVYDDSQEKLVEFSSYVSLPSFIHPVGIGYFKLFIANQLEKLVQKVAFENQRIKLKELQRSYSELQISNDMLLQLSRETDETVIIHKILELFKIITAAHTLIYVPVPFLHEFYYSFPGSEDFSIQQILRDIEDIDKTVQLKESQKGFYLRFQSTTGILGYMLIDHIPIPDYIEHYLNISSSIADICALIIGNVKNFTKIREQNKKQVLLNQVLEQLFYSDDETDEIHNILGYLKDYTGVKGIAIRIKENEGYPYYDYIGMSHEFIQKENDIKEYSDSIGQLEDLQCFCGSVISGRVNRDLSCYTENGSFWIGDAAIFNQVQDSGIPFNLKGSCVSEGYNSIVLIPLVSKEKIQGLIQFNDTRKNLFSREDVLFLEKVCNSIGLALNRKKLRKDLENSKLQAESANKAKSEFLANMSHEIRTPLNAIMGFSDLISNLSLSEKQKKYFDSINMAGHSLLTLINDILDLSKIEAGMLELQYEYFDIKDVLKEIQLIFQLKLVEKDLKFEIDLDNNLPPSLYLDEVRIRQILLNLVGNAIKFTNRGFIRIAISLISLNKEDKTLDLSIEVEDSGIGIPDDDLEMIFEEFKQQSSHDNRIYGGTGLGLSIVKRLTERMKGHLTVKSTVGVGSSFKVNLLGVKIGEMNVSKDLNTKVRLKDLKFHSQRVLIVDDIVSNRDMVRELLHSVNLRTAEAANGKEGLMTVEEFNPDLILLDIRMPVMDGYEMLAELKKNKNTNHIPVIAMTASVYTDINSLIREQGFYNYLLKPIDINKLLQDIYFLFNKKELTSKVDSQNMVNSEKDDLPDLEDLNIEKLPSAFISAVEDNLIKRIDLLSGAVIIRDVKELGYNLSDLCREYNVSAFKGFSKDIIQAAEMFDVDRINRLLTYFKSLFKVEKSKNNRGCL